MNFKIKDKIAFKLIADLYICLHRQNDLKVLTTQEIVLVKQCKKQDICWLHCFSEKIMT